jgi:hypothetical protein
MGKRKFREEYLTYVDKLNFVNFSYNGVALGSSQFFLKPHLPKNDFLYLKSGLKYSLALLVF